jgi:GntR family transcriptional repressor for pyruvate dehydrogenase complex
MLEPIKRARLYETVAHQIKTLIRNGTLKVGDQLPSERELTTQLNVSRTSIREALRALEMAGYIESRVGVSGGTFVKEVSVEQIVEPFAMALCQHKDFVLDILEVRRVLEVEIAGMAADRRSAEDLACIEKSLADMQTDIARGGIGLDGDSDFHYALAQAVHNQVLLKVVDTITQITHETRRDTLELPEEPGEALEEHRRIAEAVRAADAHQAALLMRRHLARAVRNVEAVARAAGRRAASPAPREP